MRLADRHLISDKTGVIKNIWTSRVAPNDPDLFVCSVETPNISHYTRRPFLGDCGGAGLTKMDAKAAAIGETVERYCASIYYDRDLTLGTYREVRTDREAVSPTELPVFHERQYEYLDYTRFTEDTKIGWVEAWSLSEGIPTYVPACSTYLPYFPRLSRGEKAILPTVSTGCACGRSYEEAIVSGLYEVIERDVFTIMWLNQLSCPRIELNEGHSVGDVFADKLNRDGLEYHLFYGDLGLDIPCMFCLLVDQIATPPMISAGAAVSLDPEEAALEALIEAAHTRTWGQQLDSEYANQTFREDYRDVRSFDDHVLLYATGGVEGATDFLFRNPERQALKNVPDRSTGEVRTDLQKAISIVSDAEFQVHVVDLTTPDIERLGLTVVRVIVPGLQPLNGSYRERILGNDRLYDLPVREGYRENDRLSTT